MYIISLSFRQNVVVPIQFIITLIILNDNTKKKESHIAGYIPLETMPGYFPFKKLLQFMVYDQNII